VRKLTSRHKDVGWRKVREPRIHDSTLHGGGFQYRFGMSEGRQIFVPPGNRNTVVELPRHQNLVSTVKNAWS